jgi:hypothetical protein
MSDEDADFEQASPDEIAALEAFEARFPPGAFMAVAEVVDCLPAEIPSGLHCKLLEQLRAFFESCPGAKLAREGRIAPLQ